MLTRALDKDNILIKICQRITTIMCLSSHNWVATLVNDTEWELITACYFMCDSVLFSIRLRKKKIPFYFLIFILRSLA